MRRLGFLVALLSLATSTWAGKRETRQMLDDLDQIKRQVYDLNRSSAEAARDLAELREACGPEGLRATQADLNLAIETLRSEVASLKAQLQSMAAREAALSEKLDILIRSGGSVAPEGTSVEQPDALPEPPQQRAEALYKTAYGDYIKDNFDLALEGFQQLLRNYPQSALADNAEYWIGESYYRQGRTNKAIQAFDRVVRNYPDGDKVPDALVRKAFALFDAKQPAQAVVILNDVLETYPGTPAAAQAREKLKAQGFLR